MTRVKRKLNSQRKRSRRRRAPRKLNGKLNAHPR